MSSLFNTPKLLSRPSRPALAMPCRHGLGQKRPYGNDFALPARCAG